MSDRVRILITNGTQLILVYARALPGGACVGEYYTVPHFSVRPDHRSSFPQVVTGLVWEYFGVRPEYVREIHYENDTHTHWYHASITDMPRPEAEQMWRVVSFDEISRWSFADVAAMLERVVANKNY